MINKGIIFTRAKIDQNGCIVFVIPKKLSEEMNKDGKFQVDFEEVKEYESRYNKITVIKS